ncbi:MAG: ABC transporter ATP-binding protein [Phycisphaerales bacterium]|nr:ABC transporter ATP-binding protein [Phycisphaerales bacterium]
MLPIRLEKLRCEFGSTVAVDSVDLHIPAGSLYFMLGPSGCGKTTLLRMIAGFQEPTSGKIFFGDRDVTHTPPEKRNAGMVFQSYALWPHLSVFDNVAFGLQVRGVSAAEQGKRVGAALEMVRMGHLAQRKPNQLSGGQQQRVALARAIVFNPEVLLLDEPLSNLDAKLRLEMRAEIKRICAEIHMTTVYVTHDQKEALSLADDLVVLRDGRIEQTGAPKQVYQQPHNSFVAELMGETNFIQGTVKSSSDTGSDIKTAAGILQSSCASADVGAQVTLSIRPESLRIADEPNCIRGVCKSSLYLGEMSQHHVETLVGILKVFELDPRETTRVGQQLSLRVQPDAVVVLAGK